MQHAPLTAIRRADYRPPAFLVDTVELRFDLDPAATIVTSRLALRRNPAHGDAAAPLHLDGEALTLSRSRWTAAPVEAQRVTTDEHGLTIADMPDAGVLEIVDPHRPVGQHGTVRPVPVRTARSSRNARPRDFAASPISRTART